MKRRTLLGTIALAAGAGLVGYRFRHSLHAQIWKVLLPKVAVAPRQATRFAVIGDYGVGTPFAWHVALMIESWKPSFVVTVGDNNYPHGAPDSIDENVGQFYHKYISPYRGGYGRGAQVNQFYPVPGHVDWDTDSLRPYLEYFQPPGNGRYYDLVRGPLHLFLLDTDEREPDGVSSDSVQARWLQRRLASSNASWKIVIGHHAPYTSHSVDDTVYMRWPFEKWGADAVISGFYHVYERLEVDGIPYFVNGTGGAWVSHFAQIDPRSKVRYNADFGAMIIDADKDHIEFRFVNRWGEIFDELTLSGARE